MPFHNWRTRRQNNRATERNFRTIGQIDRAPIQVDVRRLCEHAFSCTNACANQRGYKYHPFPTLFRRLSFEMKDKMPLKKNRDATTSVVNCGLKQRCFYKVYMLVVNCGELKLINRAMVVKR